MFYISLVTYNTSLCDLNKLIDSFEHIGDDFQLIVVDNSPRDTLKSFFNDFNFVVYIHNPSNPGFGHSHNIALKKAIEDRIDYHFVINPDVYFTCDVMSNMIEFMNQDSTVGMVMPQILNLDGSVQNLPKLLPSPFSIIMRKLQFPRFWYKSFIERYELRNIDKEIIYEAPILSGCFTLFNVKALRDIGLYDNKFFMYFEDWDISRRMNEKYKTIYYPKVSVYHGYESGANKSKKLFKVFINSAIYYFNKWGWFFDSKRRKVNKETLKQFK